MREVNAPSAHAERVASLAEWAPPESASTATPDVVSVGDTAGDYFDTIFIT